MSAVFLMGPEPRLNELPTTGVLWLFLGPTLFGVDVFFGHGTEGAEREGS